MADRPKRPGRSSTGARRRARRQDPTERVRVKAKAPLIERKDDFFDLNEGETVLHDADAPAANRAPTPVFFDEDATEVAPPPPAPTRKLRPKRPSTRRGKREREAPAIRPGRPMEIPGTDFAAAMAARAKIERLADKLPNVKIPALRSVAGLIPRAELERLEAALGGRFESRTQSKVGSPKQLGHALFETESYLSLDLEERAILLGAIAQHADRAESWQVARHLLEGVPRGGQHRARRRSLEIFASLDPRHRGSFAELASRTLHRRPILEDQDLEGGALVDHLHALATIDKLPSEIEKRGLRVRDILTLVLATLARPARIALEDGADGVLGAIEFGLAETSPGEYTRLWRHLSTGTMSVTLAGDRIVGLKKHLEKVERPFDSTNTPLRLGFEVLAGLVRPRRGASRDAFLMPGAQGVDADVVAHALSLIYGAPYSVAAGGAALRRSLGSVRRELDRVPPVYISVLHEAGERLFVLDHVGSDRIFVRTPHGASSKTTGMERKRPNRLIEDPDRGLESLPLDFLEGEAGVVIAPTT